MADNRNFLKNLSMFVSVSLHDAKTTGEWDRVFRKSYARQKKHGWQWMVDRLETEYNSIHPTNIPYLDWIRLNEQDLLYMDKKYLVYQPLISVIIPTYNTDKKYLTQAIKSVLEQTYKNWELCIADDASTNVDTLKTLKYYQKEFPKIKVHFRENNGHISEASNTALSLVLGDYVAFLDHDDTLAPNALYEVVKTINDNPHAKLIYSDEDKIDGSGNRFDPHFKSGWNPDMFFSQNYVSHLCVIKKEILDQIGGFRKGVEGSQDYDLILRSLQYIEDEEIIHISKILYHWRAIDGSTALSSDEKNYTTTAGLNALKEYFINIDPKITVREGMLPNTYKVEYPIPVPQPLVSLLIPTRDGYEILSKCVNSILNLTIYENYEIIILDNQTSDHKTLDFFQEIIRNPKVKILKYDAPFNYSAINNYGVKHANGAIIGLINNDIEVIAPEWLSEMVQHAIRPEIGAVGAKLYYANDTIQHAGVVLGIGGVAGHSHKYFSRYNNGYFSRLNIIQDYSAVTGACLVVGKELYHKVGGLDEENLTVAFNDIDFCMKLQEKGYRNLWTPYAELYHHESISRGSDESDEKKTRFQSEVLYMKSKWQSKLEVDALYNRNLTNKHENFGLNL
ncbi:MAG: glycosyltransferase family 2 protein [Sulfuricurvum sp.]